MIGRFYWDSMQRIFFSPKWVGPSGHTFSCWCVKIKMLKAVIKLCRQTLSWITDLKLVMNTHHDCGGNMGWVSPGYTFFSGSVFLWACHVKDKKKLLLVQTPGHGLGHIWPYSSLRHRSQKWKLGDLIPELWLHFFLFPPICSTFLFFFSEKETRNDICMKPF